MYNCIRSMKKVLIVFNHPAPYKVRLFNELSKFFDLHVIFERQTNKDRNKAFYFEENYKFTQHKIKGIAIGKENFISNGLVKHLKQNKYDLIIMNGYSQFAEMKAIKYLKKQNIPYVLYINGGIINAKESRFKKNLKTRYISGAESYFSPDLESNKYLEYYGADESRILNYPYSTIFESEIAEEQIDKNSLRKELNIDAPKMFVCSGQLIKRKNVLSLVKEWKNYPEDYVLYLIGDGNQKKEICDFIQENNMKNVILTGFMPRNNTLKYLKAANAFCFPSNEDIYGHVVNESLSQGTPVISTKHANSSLKLIKNNENGFLLNSLTGNELKDAIEFCLSNDLSKKCISVAKENTIELMTNTHVEMINKVIKL